MRGPEEGGGAGTGTGASGSTPVRRKLAAILAADAVGYSRMMGADEEGTLRVLRGHRQSIDAVIALHGGRIVGTAGDSVLAEFESAVVAVRCAVEIQDALKTRNAALPEGERLLFRIGINLGDVIVSGDDLLGDGVNVAARLESIAEPGGINVSSSVYDQIAGKLDLGFVDVGPQTLKNIARPIHVYRVGPATGPRPAVPKARARSRAWRGWAVGAAAVVAVGVAVWGLGGGWPGPVPPVALPAADPELARARAEAEEARRRARAEEERAREAQRLLDEGRTEAARAQAAAELARARAEAEAIKRRAESEAAAARQQVTERPAAPPPAAPAPAASARTPVSRYDGPWIVTRDCEPERPGVRAGRIPIVVANDEFVVEAGPPGQPGSIRLRGRPSPDGELELNGTVVGLFARNRGRELPVRFKGRAEGDRFVLAGEFGQRPCTLTLARAN